MITQAKNLEKTSKEEGSGSSRHKKIKSLNESISSLETKLSWVKINGDKTQIDNLIKILKKLKSMR